jgi:hypothetical protein
MSRSSNWDVPHSYATPRPPLCPRIAGHSAAASHLFRGFQFARRVGILLRPCAPLRRLPSRHQVPKIRGEKRDPRYQRAATFTPRPRHSTSQFELCASGRASLSFGRWFPRAAGLRTEPQGRARSPRAQAGSRSPPQSHWRAPSAPAPAEISVRFAQKKGRDAAPASPETRARPAAQPPRPPGQSVPLARGRSATSHPYHWDVV